MLVDPSTPDLAPLPHGGGPFHFSGGLVMVGRCCCKGESDEKDLREADVSEACEARNCNSPHGDFEDGWLSIEGLAVTPSGVTPFCVRELFQRQLIV